MQIILTSELLLAAYGAGLFPMADDAQSDDVHWVCPELRGQLSIPEMHIPRRLKKSVRQMKINGEFYEIRINSNFEGVIAACAQETAARQETWINAKIIDAYCRLYDEGQAHCVECWQNGEMVGGLYGIAIGAAFFGESMFSTVTDASKVTLVHLVARLHRAGFKILDTQFTNEHLKQFGVYELHHEEYMAKLEPILSVPCIFNFEDIAEFQLVTEYITNRLDSALV